MKVRLFVVVGVLIGAVAWAWAAQGETSSAQVDKPSAVATGLTDQSSLVAAPRDVVYAYELRDRSLYMDGCFGSGTRPCLCRIRVATSLEGTFGLSQAPSEEPAFDVYEITDVQWVATFGDEEIEITGSGLYKVGRAEGEMTQRLTMDLEVGGAETAFFDSGLVPGGDAGFPPSIDIAIRMPDAECTNVVLNIVAGPAGVESAAAYEEPTRRPRIDAAGP